MERITTYGSLKEEKKLISEYLSLERKKQGKDPQKRDSWTWEEHSSDSLYEALATPPPDGEQDVVIGYVVDEETGIMIVYEAVGENLILYSLNKYEADPKNYTYPFRNVLRGNLRFLLNCGAIFYKPERAISLDEALTPEGADIIYRYPIDYEAKDDNIFFLLRETIENYEAEEFFEEVEDETSPSGKAVVMQCLPLPKILEEMTGVSIRKDKDYTKALEKHLKRKLNAEERQQAEGLYYLRSGDLLLAYAAYEFARTEDYSHLQEILSSYEKFGLEKDWYIWTSSHLDREERNRYESAEQEVISRYLATKARRYTGAAVTLQDIAEVTGIPYPELLKAERLEIWEI